jgi:nucleotide-binding universal stress UspA family protein
MKTIIIPTDFSDCANNASEYAAKLAKSIDAKVLLLHVYHVPLTSAPDFPVEVKTAEDLQKENEIQLKQFALRLEARSGIIVNYKAVMGLAVDVILEEQNNADLIVMGMHGASKIQEALIGSIVTTVLRKSKVPVLVIPKNVSFKSIEQIVFACDYNPQTDMQALDALQNLLHDFSAKIHVFHVKMNANETSLEETISGVNIESKLHYLEHVYDIVESEDPVSSINDFIEKIHADMLAIIPHRYKLFERIFHKSISKSLAFHTHIPLLALPEVQKTSYIA